MKFNLWFSGTMALIVTWLTESPMAGAVVASLLFGVVWALIGFFQAIKARGWI